MTIFQQTFLNKQEIKWILERRITRLTDKHEVLIYPMGAERYLASILFRDDLNRYKLSEDIKNKEILVIPGYGNSSFLFAQANAKSVTVYDKDPVTIAWVKAFKKYYHYQEFDTKGSPYPSISNLLDALTDWYPRLLRLPNGRSLNLLRWLFNPRALRRIYLFYMITLVQNAIKTKAGENVELDKPIQFHVGELKDIPAKSKFDTAFVPYLLGVQNGIELEKEITQFIKTLTHLVPNGNVIVTPTQNKKEFYIAGKQYLKAKQGNLEDITDLKPFILNQDSHWFGTQGLLIFGNSKSK